MTEKLSLEERFDRFLFESKKGLGEVLEGHVAQYDTASRTARIVPYTESLTGYNAPGTHADEVSDVTFQVERFVPRELPKRTPQQKRESMFNRYMAHARATEKATGVFTLHPEFFRIMSDSFAAEGKAVRPEDLMLLAQVGLERAERKAGTTLVPNIVTQEASC